MVGIIPSFLRWSGWAAVVLLAGGLIAALPTSDAVAKRPVPDSVKVACSGDYKRFCGRYKIGTSKLNQCMRSNGKRLSRVCIRALVDNGMVPRRLLRRARRR